MNYMKRSGSYLWSIPIVILDQKPFFRLRGLFTETLAVGSGNRYEIVNSVRFDLFLGRSIKDISI